MVFRFHNSTSLPRVFKHLREQFKEEEEEVVGGGVKKHLRAMNSSTLTLHHSREL